jgi:hypothetical protein
MRPLALVLILIIANTSILLAQSPPPVQKIKDSAAIEQMVADNDSIITYKIVDSCIHIARGKRIQPDWAAIKELVRDRYDSIYADRTVTKAEIYYYYNHDWAKCATAYTHFVNNYESLNRAGTMNNETNFVLRHSNNPEEWKIALRWINHAIELVPNEPDFRETRDKLLKKINGQ